MGSLTMPDLASLPMPEFNTTLVHPQTVYFQSGFATYGIFRNNTIFTGPGLMQFECEDPGFSWWFCFFALIFIIISYFIGKHTGKDWAVAKFANCENEEERMKFASRYYYEPLTVWPGERKVDGIVKHRLALCRNSLEMTEYVNGLRPHGYQQAEAVETSSVEEEELGPCGYEKVKSVEMEEDDGEMV